MFAAVLVCWLSATSALTLNASSCTILPGVHDLTLNWTITLKYLTATSTTTGVLLQLKNLGDTTTTNSNTNNVCFVLKLGAPSSTTTSNFSTEATNNAWKYGTVVVSSGVVVNKFVSSSQRPPCGAQVQVQVGDCVMPTGGTVDVEHFRLFQYALADNELGMIENVPVSPTSCGVALQAVLRQDLLTANRTFPFHATGAPMVNGNVSLPCPSSVEAACSTFSCAKCRALSSTCQFCKDTMRCVPKTMPCGPSGLDTSCFAFALQDCDDFLSKCDESCGRLGRVHSCRCDANQNDRFIKCAVTECSINVADCRSACEGKQVTKCECGGNKTECGAQLAVPVATDAPTDTTAEQGDKATPFAQTPYLWAVVGVGICLLLLCGVVCLVVAWRVARKRRAKAESDDPITMMTAGAGEAVSMTRLSPEMSSARNSFVSGASRASRTPQFTCTFCQKAFFTSAELQEHIPQHNRYNNLSIATSDVEYDRALPTNDELAMTRDSRHAEPTVDPSLPAYAQKPDEFAKFQAAY